MEKIRKGDEVVVIAGKDKGRRGTVTRIIAETERLVVENVNVARKHVRPNPQQGVQGGIVEKEMPLHRSNVMVWNQAVGKGDRIGIKTLEDGRRVRFFKSNHEVVDV